MVYVAVAALVLCMVCPVWLVRAKERQRQHQRERIAEEIVHNDRERKMAAKLKAEESARLAALEREQQRIAKEQARQAEQLAKHEEQLAKLEFCMTQAEADITAESEQIASLYALMDIATAEQAAAVPGSKADIRAQKQIISYQSAIHAAEKRKAKAEFTKQTAQQKLSA